MHDAECVRDASEPLIPGKGVSAVFEDLVAPSDWLAELAEVHDFTGARAACGRVLMFESLDRDAGKHSLESVFWHGHSTSGVYRVWTYWPDCDDLKVEASFEPWPWTVDGEVQLLDFRLSRTRRGRDLLAHVHRTEPVPHLVGRAMRRTMNDNVDAAMRIIAAHDAGRPLPTAEPVPRADADLEALLASRPYPLRQLLKDGKHWSEEHWIAEVAGAGTMVYGDQYSRGDVVFLWEGGGMVPFAGLSDLAQSLARSLSFRPSDEDADPGLAKRFAAAYDTIHPRRSFFDDAEEFVMLGDGTRVPGPTLGELLAAVDRPMRDHLGRGLGLAPDVDPLRSH